MNKHLVRFTLCLLLVVAQVSPALASSENVTGTHGDVIVNGDDSGFFASGVVIRSKSSRPWLALRSGGSDANSGLLVFNSVGAELLRVRSDGLVTLGGVEGSAWGAALSPAIEHKNSSMSFGDNTEIMLSSNAYYAANGLWYYRTHAAAANYYLLDGQHNWRVAQKQPVFTPTADISWLNAMTISDAGAVRIGPQHAAATYALRVSALNSNGFAAVFQDLADGVGSGVLLDMQGNSKISVSNLVIGGSTIPSLTSVGSALQLNPTGGRNVEIGTAAAPANLVVNGEVSGAKVLGAVYQDVAEWVPSDEPLTDATIVIVDPNKDDQVVAATRPYDTRVAGVVSPNPGVLLGVAGAGKYKVATTGRVKVKVDASTNPIARGDLLVSSSKPGVAMKSIPVRIGDAIMHRPGTLIGKALEPLASGEGEILVLLSLQ